MGYQVDQQYRTYGNQLMSLVKRPRKPDKSTRRPVDLANVKSIHGVSSEDGTIDSFCPLTHTSIYNATSQVQEELYRPSTHTRGPEVDAMVLINTLTFYPGYIGYVAGSTKSKKAAGGYSVR
ncbi:hypothetical protein SARC_09987 [Sphaeroforma arctica JP610]|uniref:Uncharacterized protein n=1 Tax=Sphaeroforma arctica JP610 TaxID=667725 RepID=A0A0L0FM49_9EUKA|nr:hypothetical protein SARC_09987 [Sphaeroforma arctica JP610]KNC77556.1 hypothetical protein SARC_09987 [Sphaeroforma arctica JP610]|eukprot:XP_014151458.1 hypothetical protein SARC_09987 [Sphaeroforma arctica JP610]